jgi:hypothetical protein
MYSYNSENNFGPSNQIIVTTGYILKNREAIKATDAAKGVKSFTSKRLPAVEEVENF